MKHYIIDGNNLIGKIKSLHKMQQSNKQGSREKLSFMIDNYFHDKKAKVTIHFDGFAKLPIKLTYANIIYSENHSADSKIKNQIEMSNNRRIITVITSDNNLCEYARVCSTSLLKSEEFAKILSHKIIDDEEDRIIQMKNSIEEFKKIFGVDDD
ncbi:MAG: NYN domain-containing protein [Bacteroidetes bacterium]|nr:NYN domain-containing protein [Bacteroidota bacterium]